MYNATSGTVDVSVAYLCAAWSTALGPINLSCRILFTSDINWYCGCCMQTHELNATACCVSLPDCAPSPPPHPPMSHFAPPQLKELGVILYECSCLALDLHRLFSLYWQLQNKDFIPSIWSKRVYGLYNKKRPLQLILNDVNAESYPSVSRALFQPLYSHTPGSTLTV